MFVLPVYQYDVTSSNPIATVAAEILSDVSASTTVGDDTETVFYIDNGLSSNKLINSLEAISAVLSLFLSSPGNEFFLRGLNIGPGSKVWTFKWVFVISLFQFLIMDSIELLVNE